MWLQYLHSPGTLEIFFCRNFCSFLNFCLTPLAFSGTVEKISSFTIKFFLSKLHRFCSSEKKFYCAATLMTNFMDDSFFEIDFKLSKIASKSCCTKKHWNFNNNFYLHNPQLNVAKSSLNQTAKTKRWISQQLSRDVYIVC